MLPHKHIDYFDRPELQNRYIPNDATVVERNGVVFFAHPHFRFDPISAFLVGSAAVGTAGTAGYVAATAGLIGTAGAVTASGVAIGGAAIIGGVSTVMQGRAAQAQGKAEKELMEYNARVQAAEGKARMSAAMLQEERVSEQQKKTRGYQRAAFAKGGISIEEGASVDVLAETYGQFTMDRALTLRGGLLDQTSH